MRFWKSCWEGLEGTYGPLDPDDEHVLAAAVVGRAGAIVTHNLKDFPEESLPAGLQVLSPQEFAANSVAIDPACALSAVFAIADRSGRSGPALTVDDIFEALLRRYEMVHAVKLLRSFYSDLVDAAKLYGPGRKDPGRL